MRDWECIFAYSGFHVLDAAPLQFCDSACPVEPHHAADAPFHAWLLYPKPAGVPVARSDVRKILNDVGTLASLEENEQDFIVTMLEKHADRLSRVALRAGSRMLIPHNIGTDVYLVIKGIANLVAYDGKVLQPFGPGDFLGEVEAGTSSQSYASLKQKTGPLNEYLTRRYIAPVYASRQVDGSLPGGCSLEVLRIPGDVFDQITHRAGQSQFTSNLFHRLRDKILLGLLDFDISDEMNQGTKDRWDAVEKRYITRLNKLSPTLKMNRILEIQGLARTLVALSAIEASDPTRPTDGSMIFCRKQGLHELGRVTRGSSFETRGIPALLHLFDGVGLIQWPGKGLAATMQHSGTYDDDALGDEWIKIKRLTFRCVMKASPELSNAHDADKIKLIYHDNNDSIGGTTSCFGISERGVVPAEGAIKRPEITAASRTDFWSCVTALTACGCEQDIAKKLAARWLASLSFVSSYIMHGTIGGKDESPGTLVRILAPHELRRLASSRDELARNRSHPPRRVEGYRQSPVLFAAGRPDRATGDAGKSECHR